MVPQTLKSPFQCRRHIAAIAYYVFNFIWNISVLVLQMIRCSELFDIASPLKFTNKTDAFQRQLNEDISSTKSSPNVLIFAGK